MPISQNPPTKRSSSLILPERKSKRQSKKLSTPNMENGLFATSFRTPDLDDSLTPSCIGHSALLKKGIVSKISTDDVRITTMDKTGNDLGSSGKKDNDPPEGNTIYLCEDSDNCDDLIDLTDLTATSSMDMPASPGPLKSPSSDNNLACPVSQNLDPQLRVQPQHIVTETTAPKRRKNNKGMIAQSFNHNGYATPIREIRQTQAPDYESLTIVELRNAVKKYGFKLKKDRQSLITLLQDIWASTNKNAPRLEETNPTIPEPDNNPPIDDSKKQEFVTRVKSDVPLWERILRYENVDMNTCTDGLSRKDKAAFHEYLGENALVYKPPPKSK